MTSFPFTDTLHPMKKLLTALILSTLVLSACGAKSASGYRPPFGRQIESSPVSDSPAYSDWTDGGGPLVKAGRELGRGS